jgi:RNA recognition motif-containing protein
MDHETERSRGFAFVDMDTEEAAKTAKEKFNGQDLHGRALKIDTARSKNENRNPAGYSGPRRA